MTIACGDVVVARRTVARQSMSVAVVSRWPLMVVVVIPIGLLGLGYDLIAGSSAVYAAYSGAAVLVLMWAAVLCTEGHSLTANRLVYAMVLDGFATARGSEFAGLGVAGAEGHGGAKPIPRVIPPRTRDATVGRRLRRPTVDQTTSVAMR